MKVAQVCSGYYPHIGGVPTVVKQMSEGLVRKGFEVEVLAQNPQGKYPATEIINNVTVRRFKTGPLGWDSPFSRDSLRSFLNSNSDKYDLIHAHGYHSFSPLYAARAKGSNKLVFNPHYHGTGHNLPMTFLLRLYRHIGKITFEKADRIICVSESEKSTVQKHFVVPDDKITVIPNGVDYERIAQAIPFSLDGRVLLCVSRLEKFKNIHLAIGAVPYLPTEYQLIIIGSGPYKQRLLQLVEHLHLADRMQILSGLSDEEVHRWYKTCDLVLNLSSQEAFGLTVLEALAAGKPVMVNNKMALAELATKLVGVYSVDAASLPPEQLADAIAQICSSMFAKPDLDEYRWDSIVERITALYQSL